MLNRWNFLKTGFYEGIKLRLTAELARQAEIRLRKSLMRLAQKRSIAGVKAALALAYWDELDVPTKVLEIINDIDSPELPVS